MLQLLGFAVLTGAAGAGVKQIKHSLFPGKGNAKKPSDFKRRKAAGRGKKGGKR